MELRTKINIAKEKKLIDHNSCIVLFGSCFVENIENYLSYFKFNNISNSHGILFNPKSIEKAIDDCVNNKAYNQHDLNYFDETWFSFNHHTKFSSPYLAKVLRNINQDITNTHKALLNASHVLITLGTSWVYRYVESENLVANCHKIPQNKFKKEILSIDENLEIIEKMISLIHQINDKIAIIFTVSPVRHVKDGLVENTQSKASLHTAIYKTINNKSTFYFPSFEIMMDDLRDYRFYKNDLLHPNKTAMSYIWNIFKQVWIDENSYEIMNEIDNIQKSILHKPFNVDSKKHQQFLKNLDTKIEVLTKKIPQINFIKKDSVNTLS
jgi:hypothetical protein